MKMLSYDELYIYHNQTTMLMVIVWALVSYLGYKLTNDRHKQRISYTIVAFGLAQEALDYINRIFLDQAYSMSLNTDLPLHFCHFGFYFSLAGIIMAVKNSQVNPKIEQFLFDCAYVLGLAAALQSLMNIDLTGVNNLIGVITFNWQHSLIILNVLWLIFAYKKKFTITSIYQSFLFMNIIIIPVGILNYFLNANYMFLCTPPPVDSLFIQGEWPFYILRIEIVYLIYVLFLYAPFKAVDVFSKKE